MEYFLVQIAGYTWYALLPGPGSGFNEDQIRGFESIIVNPPSDFHNNCIHCSCETVWVPDFKDAGFEVSRSGCDATDYWYIDGKCIVGYVGVSWSQSQTSTYIFRGFSTSGSSSKSWSYKTYQFGTHLTINEKQYDIDWAGRRYRSRSGQSHVYYKRDDYDELPTESDIVIDDIQVEFKDWTSWKKFSSSCVISGPTYKMEKPQSLSMSMANHHMAHIYNHWKEFWWKIGGYADLCQEAADRIRVDHVNLIGLTRDLIKLPHDYDNLLDFATKSHLSSSDIASLYLSGKYGARLTVEDIKTVSNNARARSPMKGTASASSDFSTSVCGCDLQGSQWITFDYRYSGFDQIWKRLDDASLTVSAEDLWDLVPFSFVADWFVDLSDIFRQIDSNRHIARLNAMNIWRSVKASYVKKTYYKGGSVTFHGKDYVRAGQPNLVAPPISLGSPTYSDHLIEMGAIVIQNV